jgi:hypothetical protein
MHVGKKYYWKLYANTYAPYILQALLPFHLRSAYYNSNRIRSGYENCPEFVHFGLLFNARWVIFLICHGEYKLHFSEMMMMSTLWFATILKFEHILGKKDTLFSLNSSQVLVSFKKNICPSSSLLQGKYLPFSPSSLRLNIFRLFVILSLA